MKNLALFGWAFLIISVAMLPELYPQFKDGQYSSNVFPAVISKSDLGIEKTKDNWTIIAIRNRLQTETVLCTHSMEPAMGCGNMYLEEPVNATTTLNIGDIVVYERPGEIDAMHQIVEEKGGCFVTKGINNILDDGCIERARIKRRVIGILFTKDF